MHSRLWLIRFWFRNRHLPIRLPPDRLLWQNPHQSLGFSAEHLKLIPIWKFGLPESVWVAGRGCWWGRPRCTTKSDLLTNKEPDQTLLINLFVVNPNPVASGIASQRIYFLGDSRLTRDWGLSLEWMTRENMQKHRPFIYHRLECRVFSQQHHSKRSNFNYN